MLLKENVLFLINLLYMLLLFRIWKYRGNGATKCLGQKDGMKANCTYTMGFCQSINTCNGSICASTFNGIGNNKTVSYKLGGLSEKPFSIPGIISSSYKIKDFKIKYLKSHVDHIKELN